MRRPIEIGLAGLRPVAPYVRPLRKAIVANVDKGHTSFTSYKHKFASSRPRLFAIAKLGPSPLPGAKSKPSSFKDRTQRLLSSRIIAAPPRLSITSPPLAALRELRRSPSPKAPLRQLLVGKRKARL